MDRNVTVKLTRDLTAVHFVLYIFVNNNKLFCRIAVTSTLVKLMSVMAAVLFNFFVVSSHKCVCNNVR